MFWADLRPPLLQIASYKQESGQIIRTHGTRPQPGPIGCYLVFFVTTQQLQDLFPICQDAQLIPMENIRLFVHTVPRKPHVPSDMLSYLHAIIVFLTCSPQLITVFPLVPYGNSCEYSPPPLSLVKVQVAVFLFSLHARNLEPIFCRQVARIWLDTEMT